MAHIFASGGGGDVVLAFWYHFAIMFEALFILTIIDAGTRVGRFMLQDLLGHAWKPLARTSWMPGVIGTSLVIVAAWGYFLIQGVRDPLGGINSLWPLFGIANQLLAAVALSVATTIILKMHGPKFMWITCAPLAWLVLVTFSAGWQKIFSPLPRVGFLAQASQLAASASAASGQTATLIFNARLDAAVCGAFMILVSIVLVDSLRLWYGIVRGTQQAVVIESPFVLSRLEVKEI
jgi:carbon starvation protein